ncbi:branched-chain amino acid ABC transporter substrate-binding protein [Loktanella sp. 3ANDIMAR09]|uniref:ABC transporter substrate-binding protein n=1 Tax=Loktanella sp. 3ANDIMAR09 TaxID=1225657 RepID=UPI0006FCF5EA|nr:ABC transporter substrate-binding protein [Loktanella sp. 3ANDIMAR09]KQI68787.1 branched-chain amino acid ABC transporter substrate-binding protein [Loktanella sp. 3ANDIMAR09]
MLKRTLLGATILASALASAAHAQDKPEEITIGIATFLTGPASVFGVPARDAAEMLVEDLNEAGGIDGVPVRVNFIDEGAGGEAFTAEYRRQVQDEGADIMFSGISSGNCMQIAPLAEDLEVINIMWDCGTQRVFEEGEYDYVFRTQSHATGDMLALVLYLLKTKPDFQTIAVVNQDYAWGRDSWEIFSTALKAMKPDVEVVGEFFPAFGAPDFSTEISRLSATRPDVILSTSWGGDLNTFVQQASQRGLVNQSQFILGLGESSLEALGSALPDGVIIGGRGDHYFEHPEMVGQENFDSFVAEFKETTGSYPIYSVFHMVQAFEALKAAYAKAIEDGDGVWPDDQALIAAYEGLEFQGLGRPVTIRAEDHQGIEAQIVGTTVQTGDYPFATLENIMIFDGETITTPVGESSIEWVSSLTPEFVQQVEPTTFD